MSELKAEEKNAVSRTTIKINQSMVMRNKERCIKKTINILNDNNMKGKYINNEF